MHFNYIKHFLFKYIFLLFFGIEKWEKAKFKYNLVSSIINYKLLLLKNGF
jgi:hypothetical protein